MMQEGIVWRLENNKNHPEVKSLLLLSSLFNVSFDMLVKGDLEKMKEEDITLISLANFIYRISVKLKWLVSFKFQMKY